MYRRSGYSPSASRNPCSTVPGFPNICVIPSSSSCSRIAERPCFDATLGLGCGPDRGRVEAPLLEPLLEHLDHLLAREVGVRRRAAGHERVVDDDGGLVAVVAGVRTTGRGGVA